MALVTFTEKMIILVIINNELENCEFCIELFATNHAIDGKRLVSERGEGDSFLVWHIPHSMVCPKTSVRLKSERISQEKQSLLAP